MEFREVCTTIKFNKFSKRFNNLDKILAQLIDTTPTNIFIYPYNIIAPAMGTATMFDRINVKDRVLNSNTIIGIIKICAAIVMDIAFAILIGIVFEIKLYTDSFKVIIPKVPK